MTLRVRPSMLIFLVALFLSVGIVIGPTAQTFIGGVREDAEDLASVFSALLERQSSQGQGLEIEPTPRSVSVAGVRPDLGPPFVAEVPEYEFPEGPVPNRLFSDPNGRIITVRSVEEIRNGWAFLFWYFYSAMMQDAEDAREYVKDRAISDQFFFELIEEGIWDGYWYPLATHLVSFNSNAPEEGITVKARINFVDGNVVSTEGVPITAVIQFEDERWWIISVHRTR